MLLQDLTKPLQVLAKEHLFFFSHVLCEAL